MRSLPPPPPPPPARRSRNSATQPVAAPPPPRPPPGVTTAALAFARPAVPVLQHASSTLSTLSSSSMTNNTLTTPLSPTSPTSQQHHPYLDPRHKPLPPPPPRPPNHHESATAAVEATTIGMNGIHSKPEWKSNGTMIHTHGRLTNINNKLSSASTSTATMHSGTSPSRANHYHPPPIPLPPHSAPTIPPAPTLPRGAAPVGAQNMPATGPRSFVPPPPLPPIPHPHMPPPPFHADAGSQHLFPPPNEQPVRPLPPQYSYAPPGPQQQQQPGLHSFPPLPPPPTIPGAHSAPVGSFLPPPPGGPNLAAPGMPQQHGQHVHSSYTVHATAASSTKPQRIDPAQIPQPPLFTEPTDVVIPPTFDPHHALWSEPPPPAADTRFLVLPHNTRNAVPNMIRSTVATMPRTRGIWHETGDLPLAVLLMPLAVSSSSPSCITPYDMDTALSLPSTCFLPDGTATTITVPRDATVPVLQGPVGVEEDAATLTAAATTTTSATTSSKQQRLPSPPRCDQCQAYWNPYCSPVGTCNMCGSRNRQYQDVIANASSSMGGWFGASTISSTTMETATDWFLASRQYGTVEYPVDGPYVTRLTPVQPCHVYGLDATLPWPQLQLCFQQLARLAREMASVAAAGTESTIPTARIGWCLVSAVGIAFWNIHEHRYNIMSDMTEQPFSPLPLHDWTWDVATTTTTNDDNNHSANSAAFEAWLQHDWQPLRQIWVQTKVAIGNNKVADAMDLSCGGAALACLVDSLTSTGGTVTWIGGAGSGHRQRFANYGMGKLDHRIREDLLSSSSATPSSQQLEDLNGSTPLQVLYPTATSSHGSTSAAAATAAAFYRDLASTCAQHRVAIDLVLLSPMSSNNSITGNGSSLSEQLMHQTSFVDLATLSELCRTTCGRLTCLPAATALSSTTAAALPADHWSRWDTCLYHELRRSTFVSSSSGGGAIGYDAVLKVRVSAGLSVKAMSPTNPGTCLVNESLLSAAGSSPEVELSRVMANTCLAVELEHRVGGISQAPNNNRGDQQQYQLPPGVVLAFIQSALLYTTVSGQRRVRVATLALRVANTAQDVFRSADFGAIACMLLRDTAFRLRVSSSSSSASTWEDSASSVGDTQKSSLYHPRLSIRNKARDALYYRCIHILSNYRKNTVARQGSAGQLILPERLQMLPLFTMCTLKSTLLRPRWPRRYVRGGVADHNDNGVAVDVVWSPTPDERAWAIHHAIHATPSTSMILVHPNMFAIYQPELEVDSDMGRIVYSEENNNNDAALSSSSSSMIWNDPSSYSQLPSYPHHHHLTNNNNNQNLHTIPSSSSSNRHRLGLVRMSQPVIPSITFLSDTDVYLIDDGLRILLYIGNQVPNHVAIQIVSGKRGERDEITPTATITHPNNNNNNSHNNAVVSLIQERLQNMIWQIRRYNGIDQGCEAMIRPTFAPVLIVQQHRRGQQSPLELAVLDMMISDANAGEKDCNDFLCDLHRRIADSLAG